MKKILLSFADSKYIQQQNILNLSANSYFDEIINVGPEDIGKNFFEKNKNIFNNQRGYGYWLWKSYFIRRTLDYINYNDILMYVDAGNEFINNPDSIFSLLDYEDLILFKNRDGNPNGDVWVNSMWTKADCFNLMECNSDKYKNGYQVDGSYIIIKKTDRSISFIDEYLKFSCNENIISDLPNITGDDEIDFKDHRHDQSILSLLAIKHDINLYESPSESSNHIKKDYPQVINHFRRNLEWSHILSKINYTHFIYTHLGLGDHLILNGLVRSLIKPDHYYYMFVKKIYKSSLQSMYSDLTNINFIFIDNDNDAQQWLDIFNNIDIIKVGFETLNQYIDNIYFDKAFYNQYNLPINYKWEKCIFNRKHDIEDNLFKSLGLEKGKYIFLHDDESRGFNIDKTFIKDKTLPIVTPHQTDNIFDWCKVIENASEIHCICSSFKHLADNLNIDNIKLYYHLSYIGRNNLISTSKHKWNII
jgi:hypothetical protein